MYILKSYAEKFVVLLMNSWCCVICIYLCTYVSDVVWYVSTYVRMYLMWCDMYLRMYLMWCDMYLRMYIHHIIIIYTFSIFASNGKKTQSVRVKIVIKWLNIAYNENNYSSPDYILNKLSLGYG